MRTVVTLDSLPLSGRARIVEIDWNHPAGERLLALGLLPDHEVEMLGVAPLGDPIAVFSRGLRLAIRRTDAASILVEVAEEGLP